MSPGSSGRPVPLHRLAASRGRLRKLWTAPGTMLFFRSVGAIAIAAVACLVPEVGPNRFWLAGLLVFVFVPAAIWLERYEPIAENGWGQPLFDLAVLLALIHLVPAVWFAGLVVGVMVVQAPSVAESRKSFLCYGAFAALLVCGMTLAAVVHDVPGWELPMLMTVALYPSIIYYAHRQATRENEIRARAGALEGLQIVAGGVAHDFNNILTGVLGYAELAQAELAPGHPAREAIDEVVGGTQRASLLSGRLLAFSGNGPASDELLDVDRELRELVALMEPVVPKGIELKLDSRMRGARVRADRAQLQQVVMNLVLNAAEATETRPGSVWVTLDRAGGTGDRGAWLELCVRDQGVGIPRELRPSIFEPFVTSKEGGHGLGLASVRGIMNELGGGIEVRSVEGQGTEIRVRLPVQDQPLASPMPERLPAAPGRGGLALVVDDEERVRTLVARLLRRLGYRVLEAEDAQRALDCFRTRGREIEVVVLDLRMPGMDGWECLEALREIRRDVPVLVCSGYDPGAVEERDDPRLGFLRKPFRIDHLREALDRLAAGVQ